MTSLVDLFPVFLRRGFRRELVLLVICCTCCTLGLSLVTEVCTVHTKEFAKNRFDEKIETTLRTVHSV